MKTALDQLADLAMAAAGAFAITVLVMAPARGDDSWRPETSPASASVAGVVPAATRPQQAADPATRPVLPARSGIVVYYLAHADAQRIAQILQLLFAEEPLVAVSDPRTNCVIMSGNRSAIEKAVQLIGRLDIPLATAPVVVVGRPVTRPVTQATTAPATRPASHPATGLSDIR